MHLVHLILGSNSTDKQECLSRAIFLLEKEIGDIVSLSSVYESEAWGYESTNSYLNQALIIQSSLSPEDLLTSTQEIEKLLGRTSKTIDGHYTDRPIDIDLLFYEERIIESPDLCIPHPHIAKRRFVLEPLNEMDPEFIHPVSKKSISQLLEECDDTTSALKLGENRC